MTTRTEEIDRTQKPLHPSINSDFTPFHEPKNRSPNISLIEIIENQQKVRQKLIVDDERAGTGKLGASVIHVTRFRQKISDAYIAYYA